MAFESNKSVHQTCTEKADVLYVRGTFSKLLIKKFELLP